MPSSTLELHTLQLLRVMNLLADRLLNLLIVAAGCGHCGHAQQDEQRQRSPQAIAFSWLPSSLRIPVPHIVINRLVK